MQFSVTTSGGSDPGDTEDDVGRTIRTRMQRVNQFGAGVRLLSGPRNRRDHWVTGAGRAITGAYDHGAFAHSANLRISSTLSEYETAMEMTSSRDHTTQAASAKMAEVVAANQSSGSIGC